MGIWQTPMIAIDPKTLVFLPAKFVKANEISPLYCMRIKRERRKGEVPMSVPMNPSQPSQPSIRTGIIVLILLAVGSIAGGMSVYFNSSIWQGYIQLLVAILGVFPSIKLVKPGFLGKPVDSRVLLAVSIGLLILILILQAIIIYQNVGHGASVAITSPAEGSHVPQTVTIEGTAANISADKQLWILITVEGVTGYFPQPGPISVNPGGKWSAQITVGIQTDKGKKFTLYAVLADKDGQATIDKFFKQPPRPNYVGITNLQGITTMNTVNVIRD